LAPLCNTRAIEPLVATVDPPLSVSCVACLHALYERGQWSNTLHAMGYVFAERKRKPRKGRKKDKRQLGFADLEEK
jgi:hypothetical protein